MSPARPRQLGSGPGRLGPEPDRAGKARTRLRKARCAYGSRVSGSAHLGTGRLGPGRLGPGPTSTSPGSPKAAGPRWQLSHSPGERTKVPGPRGDRLPALRGGPASSTSIDRGTGSRQAPRAAAASSAAKTRNPLPFSSFACLLLHLHRATLDGHGNAWPLGEGRAGARRPGRADHPRVERWSQGGWAQTGHPYCSPFGDDMGSDSPEQFQSVNHLAGRLMRT